MAVHQAHTLPLINRWDSDGIPLKTAVDPGTWSQATFQGTVCGLIRVGKWSLRCCEALWRAAQHREIAMDACMQWVAEAEA